MVIVGILVGMVMPRVGTAIAQRQLDRAQQQLAVDLQAAQQLAGRHRRPVRVQLTQTYVGYEVVDRTTPTNVYIRRNLGTASGTNASITMPTVDFFPNGLAAQGASGTWPATATITVNGKTRTVTVTQVGHVRRR